MVANENMSFVVTLGAYLGALFDAFLEEYGDEELAELATVTVASERLLFAAEREAFVRAA